MKTSQLSGIALDYAVAKCEGEVTCLEFDGIVWNFYLDNKLKVLSKGWAQSIMWIPSENWALAGPIIERERICTEVGHDGVWLACTMQNYDDRKDHMQAGSTPLEAAMRSFVSSKLGHEIKIPAKLLVK